MRPPFHVRYCRSCHSRRSRPYLESPARTAYALSQRLVRGLGARRKQASKFCKDASISSGPLVTKALSRRPCRKHRMSKASNVKNIHNISTITTGRKKSLTGSVGQYTPKPGRKFLPHTARGVRFHIWRIVDFNFNVYTTNTGECLKIALSCKITVRGRYFLKERSLHLASRRQRL